MFFPEGRIRVFLCLVPVDMRKSFDGLSALVRNTLGRDPLSGHCFVFVNRRATQIRVLYWDRTGYSLWGKRLERGRFWDWCKPPAAELDWTHLKLLLEGIEAGRQRRRYHRQAPEKLAEMVR
ncbi:MAG: IS66 family insertion sequence element accessory protein TnpB [Phycisphaerae bacterium]